MSFERRDLTRYRECISTLNSVGMARLKKYCATKKHPVRNFDRDIQIIRIIMTDGYSGCAYRFGISRQRAEQILLKYTNYAKECLSEKDGELL